MHLILFILALFLIVALALNFEVLLLPSLVVVGLGAACVILGIGMVAYGVTRKGTAVPRESESPGDGKTPASAGCLPVIVGSLYGLIGIGMFILQAIGYFH